MNSKLALMPLLIMSAFSYAADEATPEAPVQQQLQEVHVRADAKRVKAARSYSIASDGDLRDRVIWAYWAKLMPLPRRLPSSTTTNKPSITPKRVLWWMQ